ncbi:sigma factor-like helix-turn-helix DNA-binding protein [Bradyrhizobium sp.]|uniref:sigma factor-like helix-turn-helix DNA-binding protein n=1 Tax=Bradyrhizobium sp. TaxID=376 RepID=UPI0025C02F45|nr:sigma factor-like helix-turn-helix DNA-binding protein [Bradyrhizobium sp.]
MLLLCDVLGWTSNEAATLLGGSTASINSALQRARETLSKRYPDGRPQVAPKPDASGRDLTVGGTFDPGAHVGTRCNLQAHFVLPA